MITIFAIVFNKIPVFKYAILIFNQRAFNDKHFYMLTIKQSIKWDCVRFSSSQRNAFKKIGSWQLQCLTTQLCITFRWNIPRVILQKMYIFDCLRRTDTETYSIRYAEWNRWLKNKLRRKKRFVSESNLLKSFKLNW